MQEILANARLDELFRRALEEDGSDRDITTLACGLSLEPVRALVRARGPQTIAGLDAIPALLDASGFPVTWRADAEDGDRVEAGATLAELQGPAPHVLALERPLLNTLSRLSGIATLTRMFADAIPAGCIAKVYDTRKTTPGWRALEKYAVVRGGGGSHRMGLHDAVLIKDNHLASKPAGVGLADFLRAACERARTAFSPAFVEIEVDTLEQFDTVLTLGHPIVDYVLLDNFSLADMGEAVRRRDELAPGIQLEASGNVSLETIAGIARTGVERISAGALTHQATWTDIGLDVA